MVLTPEALKAPLRNCGYRRDLLRTDVPFGGDSTLPLVGFAQLPADSRSACVAVLSAMAHPREVVEAFRLVGAPLVFVCFQDTLQWWKQGAKSAEWLESIPAGQVDSFFKAHEDEFSPEAVYRAKTWGRFREEYQLEFVDLGLMPLVEEEVGEALGELIERNVSALAARLGWSDVTSSQGHWLLQTVFWLISGKILRDKDVDLFQNLDLVDVQQVFDLVARHYGTEPLPIGAKKTREALKESARDVERFSNLALTTTEALAYVYENTLISKKTRSSLGTHSTPSYLVDYIVGNLTDWIEEIPVSERSVFEPACGHAAFLVSAMRLLTQLLPEDKQIASRRGPYLRRRLHGTDIDSFALELARLSLTLTDIPNPDGWDLEVADMFVGGRLAEQARANTVLLANPPFANFTADDRSSYAEQGTQPRFVNRAAEMLWRTVSELKPGSVFGIVLPQTLLHARNAVELRRFLLGNCELREICLFPDKVFSFSDAESAVLLGRKLPTGSRRLPTTRYRHVREHQLPAFRSNYEVSRTEVFPQSRFVASETCSLRVADLARVWEFLGSFDTLGSTAVVGKGLEYLGRALPTDAITYSESPFAKAERGFVHFDSEVALHELPTAYWMNLDTNVIRRAGVGTTTGTPQVLMNYAPVSRGPWRLKGLIDCVGRPVSSNFVVVRPRQSGKSLLRFWAILNSPIANAYAYCHLSKRHNIVGDIRQIPVPSRDSFDAVEKGAEAYLKAVADSAEATVLRNLLLQVDVEVLKLYSLPLELERALLDLFSGYDRVGVPFQQSRYLPQELERPIRLADFLDYEASWPRANRRRGNLIKKNIAGAITDVERSELDELQAYADYHIETDAPRRDDVFVELQDALTTLPAGRDNGKAGS